MIGETVAAVLRNLPVLLFVAAIVLAMVTRGHGTLVERLLAWTLLLPIGVTGLWAGVSHVFFPAIAAAHIGWQVSPFQFEVGMADFAIGVGPALHSGENSLPRPRPSAPPPSSCSAMRSVTSDK
jgi:hypothetical protein